MAKRGQIGRRTTAAAATGSTATTSMPGSGKKGRIGGNPRDRNKGRTEAIPLNWEGTANPHTSEDGGAAAAAASTTKEREGRRSSTGITKRKIKKNERSSSWLATASSHTRGQSTNYQSVHPTYTTTLKYSRRTDVFLSNLLSTINDSR